MVRSATETPAGKQTLEKLGWERWYLGGEAEYKNSSTRTPNASQTIMDSLGLKK